jgi:hypothetical protein
VHPLEEQLFYFMPHKNGVTNYRKGKIGAFMNNNCSSKQWVARCHTDVLIQIKIGNPLEKQSFYLMPHKNGETSYRKIKIDAFMTNNCR